MFVSRKRRIFNHVRNFFILVFLCYCYKRSLLEPKSHEEKRPKFFAELKRHQNEFASNTEEKTSTSRLPKSLSTEITTLKDGMITTELSATTTVASETTASRSESENLVEIVPQIMALYEKPSSAQAFTSYGFNSTASDHKSLFPENVLYSGTCAKRYQASDLPSASIIITFFNEHWTTLWAAAQKINISSRKLQSNLWSFDDDRSVCNAYVMLGLGLYICCLSRRRGLYTLLCSIPVIAKSTKLYLLTTHLPTTR